MLNSRTTMKKPIKQQPPHFTKQYCTPATNCITYIYIYIYTHKR